MQQTPKSSSRPSASCSRRSSRSHFSPCRRGSRRSDRRARGRGRVTLVIPATWRLSPFRARSRLPLGGFPAPSVQPHAADILERLFDSRYGPRVAIARRRPDPDGITTARLAGTAGRHVSRKPLDVGAAVAELRKIADGRGDLLAEQAGVTLGFCSWCSVSRLVVRPPMSRRRWASRGRPPTSGCGGSPRRAAPG
jgi:hypothetical protein